MKKIYISPSDQVENTYAVGGTNEAAQCRAIARFLKSALERCGFQAKTDFSDGNTAMYARVEESNGWGADLHICIHTNAFNGSVAGTRMFCYDLKGEGYRACKAIMEELAPITPGASDSITAKLWYEVKQTYAPCAYLEVGFHDNKEEAQWIISNTEAIAEAICCGVCSHFGVPYAAPEKKVEATPLYRVQVGAFAVKANAENLLKKLKEAGFDGYVRT